MKLRPSHFNRHLKNIGQQVMWKRSYACACVGNTSGAPDPKHALCSGKGRLWDSGIATVCGVTKQVVEPEQAALGVFDSGDMVMTVGSDSPMWQNAGKFDRILLLNSTDVFSMPFTHNSVNERIIFTVQSFSRCFWLSPDKTAIIEGGLPDIDANGYMTWNHGGEPPLGQVYSLTGTKFDEYYVLDSMPSDRNEHSGSPLPKKINMRKFDLFGR